jgi:hypothetical protein
MIRQGFENKKKRIKSKVIADSNEEIEAPAAVR